MAALSHQSAKLLAHTKRHCCAFAMLVTSDTETCEHNATHSRVDVRRVGMTSIFSFNSFLSGLVLFCEAFGTTNESRSSTWHK